MIFMKNKKVYVVSSSIGSYEDRVDTVQIVFETREDAEAYVKKHEEWQTRVKKIAIKDIITDDYYEFGDEVSSSDNSDEYTCLREEFNSKYLLKKCCGKESFDDLSDDEWDIYNDEDTDENFADWLVDVKGYSREVADATTVYNKCGDWDEYHAYYYIDEVDFIKSDKKENEN